MVKEIEFCKRLLTVTDCCMLWQTVMQAVAAGCSWLQLVAAGCSWLQLVAAGCSWLHAVAD